MTLGKFDDSLVEWDKAGRWPRVTISPKDRKLARQITWARQEHNKRSNARPTVYTPDDLFRLGWVSYEAEIAVCRFLGVEPDMTTDHWDAQDVEGHELLSPMDVKHTHHARGNLSIKDTGKPRTADTYALVTSERTKPDEDPSEVYVLRGWQWAMNVITPENYRDPDKVPYDLKHADWCLLRHHLHPFLKEHQLG